MLYVYSQQTRGGSIINDNAGRHLPAELTEKSDHQVQIIRIETNHHGDHFFIIIHLWDIDRDVLVSERLCASCRSIYIQAWFGLITRKKQCTHALTASDTN